MRGGTDRQSMLRQQSGAFTAFNLAPEGTRTPRKDGITGRTRNMELPEKMFESSDNNLRSVGVSASHLRNKKIDNDLKCKSEQNY